MRNCGKNSILDWEGKEYRKRWIYLRLRDRNWLKSFRSIKNKKTRLKMQSITLFPFPKKHDSWISSKMHRNHTIPISIPSEITSICFRKDIHCQKWWMHPTKKGRFSIHNNIMSQNVCNLAFLKDFPSEMPSAKADLSRIPLVTVTTWVLRNYTSFCQS